MNAPAIETTAGFVDPDHPAFFLHFMPAHTPRAHIVYLPPFGEEMNRCRSLAAAQARWFSHQGISSAILDYHGTGESPGDLCSTTLAVWRDNINHLLEQLLRRHHCPVLLWGFRLGALLAMDFSTIRPGRIDQLLLWQPIVSGSTFVTQLLRQRTATLVKNQEKSETTTDMKLQLAAGQSLDVGGYRLGGTLMTDLDKLEMTSFSQPETLDKKLSIFWLEHSAEEDAGLGAKSTRAISGLQQKGIQVAATTFTGDPVWQLHKRGNCDDLLQKTRELAL